MQTLTLSDLGEVAKKRRKRLGLNQKQLSDLAGCGRVFVSQFEGGKPGVRLDKAIELLNALGLELHIQSGSKGLVIEVDG